MKPGGSIIIWTDTKRTGYVWNKLEEYGYKPLQIIFWRKTSPAINPRKNFQLNTCDAEYLVWEATIFENEEYTYEITVGNNTVDNIISYRSKINEGESSWMNPLDWGAKFKEMI